MGNLQKSVWVVSRDIRPEFSDLCKAASLDGFAYLFEARTVLGLPSQRVVEEAWDFERLELLQTRYCDASHCNLHQLSTGSYSGEELAVLARMSIDAYHAAFSEDPLLPSKLLPKNYQGKAAFQVHTQLFKQLTQRLDALSSK